MFVIYLVLQPLAVGDSVCISKCISISRGAGLKTRPECQT